MESFNFKLFELQEWIKVMFERLDSAASVLALFQMTNPSADNFQLCGPLRKTSLSSDPWWPTMARAAEGMDWLTGSPCCQSVPNMGTNSVFLIGTLFINC